MQRRQVFTALATSPALSLLPSNSAHAAGGNAGGFPSTSAETKAGIAPIAAEYPEGDIRRYGGKSSAADNSKALNSALLVSANGGSAAFLPPGTWRIAATVNCVLSSSMYGMGQMSVLAPQSCDGLFCCIAPVCQQSFRAPT